MERDEEGHFPEEFRRWAVSAMERGEISATELSVQYGIRGHSTVLKWCRRYGGNTYPIMRKMRDLSSNLSEGERKLQELQNQVKIMERELKDSRLRQATLETLIEVAEQHCFPVAFAESV